MKRFWTQGLGGAALLAAAATPLLAQATGTQSIFVAPPTPNADRLAAEMRALAANPDDVRALLSAGELSVRLDDPAAALQFFARAERIDPYNPRIPAGRGGALVRLGRPGEALRLFADAERRGVAAATIAPDRALAYDLTGQPAHAQTEYRRALAAQPGDPELTRGYALSQAIAGDRDRALATLEPLLRERDRAAWRARAFVLAMAGDVAEAQQIATNMMPGYGTAFSPFFQQLARLGDPADRAFAVHRGEVGRTPARLADATMAPALPVIVRPQPVRLAVVTPAATRERSARRSRRTERPERVTRSARRERGKRTPLPAEPVAVAAATPPPQLVAPVVPMPVPVEVAAVIPTPAATPALTPAPSSTAMTPIPAAPVAVAAAPESGTAPTPTPVPSAPVRVLVAAAPTPVPAPQRVPSIDPATVVRVAVPNSGEAQLRAAAERPINPIASVSIADGPGAGPVVAAVPMPGFGATSIAPSPPVKAIGKEDDVLASILNGIAVPAAELGVAPAASVASVASAPPTAAPPPSTEPAVVVAAAVKKEPPATKVAATPAAKPAAAKPAVKKAPAKKPEAKPVEAARHWVQIAGGANKADLPKEWKRLTGVAPGALKGRTAWTTPLRFTNRLLTGPFKTAAEAQAFVNIAGKQGLSAFAWTSDAGQTIEKLPTK